MKVKLGCCNICLPGGGVFAAELIKAAGLDGMSVDLGYYAEGFPLMSKALVTLYKEAGARAGISYSNIGCSCYDFIPFAPDEGTAAYDLSVQCIQASIDAADELGARVIMIPTFGVSKIESRADFDRTAAMMKKACLMAGDKGIQIGAENVLRPEQQIEMVAQVQCDNFGLFYDSQNFYYNNGWNQVEVLEKLYPYLVPVVHVKDGTQQALSANILGEGTSDFSGVIDVLKRKDFSGWIINENYYNKQPLRQLAVDPVDVFLRDSAVLKKAVQ